MRSPAAAVGRGPADGPAPASDPRSGGCAAGPAEIRRRRGRGAAVAASCALLLVSGVPAHAAEPASGGTPVLTLPSVVITADRTPEVPPRVAATTVVLDATALDASPTVSLDAALRSIPEFSLFRRTDSLVANPTTQGVSLRGLGPSGASRSLVLLDGLPLNDPFGGWINWAAVPRDALTRVEVVPGGGATAWGNAALGGVIQLLTTPVRGTPARASALRATVLAGDFATRSADVIAEVPLPTGSAQLTAEDFFTGGYPLVAAERRGPVDVAAWSRHQSVGGRVVLPAGAATEIAATVRTFEESRGNGTRGQRNGTRQHFASVEAAGQPNPAFSWTAAAYVQQQAFAATFTSVNASRTQETPASEQFGVPATAAGANWTGAWHGTDTRSTGIGADVRAVHGETRENYAFSNDAFTRTRIAGGDQVDGGVFVQHRRALAPGWYVNVGVRVDTWRDTAGRRVEFLRSTGLVSREDAYPDRQGTELSPSAGLVWSPNTGWRLRASAQHAYRRPTLNELYRPFRQGANVTEANPELATEHATSAEAGVEWTPGGTQNPAAATPSADVPVTFSATAFWNQLQDAVANVTVAHGPGAFPLFGTLPAGGVGRQRLNLNRIQVQGLELAATWRVRDAFQLRASLLYDDATVRRASVAPGLVGKHLAEVPRQVATVGATWTAPGKILVSPRLRWIGRQFDDDENTLRLGEVVVLDVRLSHALSSHLEVFVTVENVTNARIETGRSPDGVVNTGTPRFALLGLRGRW